MVGLQADHLYAIPVAIPVALAFRISDLLASPLFSPVATGAALFALTRAPDSIRQPLFNLLQKYLSDNTISRGVSALRVLLGYGLLRQAHLYLTDLGQNNFRFISQKSRYDWPNEIAVVTGAAGGIGAVMCRDLALKGVKVMAVDIAPTCPDNLANKTRGLAGQTFYYQCDLTDREAVMALGKKIAAEHGEPSILINNAGVAFTHSTLSVSDKALHQIFDVNLLSHYWTIQAFLPSMLAKRKGHIVSTASMASFASSATLGPYSATKVGVVALHEALVQELRRVYKVSEICMTMVHPTFVRTPMTTGATAELEKITTLITPEEVSAGAMKNIFRGRGGQVILSGALGHIPVMLRSFPHWLSYALLRSAEAGDSNIMDSTATEKRMQ